MRGKNGTRSPIVYSCPPTEVGKSVPYGGGLSLPELLRPPYFALFEFWSGVDSTAKNHTAPRPCPRELMIPSLFK